MDLSVVVNFYNMRREAARVYSTELSPEIGDNGIVKARIALRDELGRGGATQERRRAPRKAQGTAR